MANNGIFITFEGGEGAGKTTQIKMLNDYLKNNGLSAYLTREPGGCPVAEQIREILVKGKADNLDEISELLLFSAARHEHVRTKINPLLADKKWVISDRFYYSTYVYQHFAGGLDFSTVEQVTKLAIGSTEPDLVFLLDIDPVEGLSRANERELFQDEDRFESKKLEFHKKVREGFLQIAEQNDNVVVINAQQPLETIHNQIIDALKNRKLI